MTLYYSHRYKVAGQTDWTGWSQPTQAPAECEWLKHWLADTDFEILEFTMKPTMMTHQYRREEGDL